MLRTLALFDKPGVSSGPYFEETVYVTPSRLGSALHSAVAREVQSAAAAIGLRSGALHAECRVNEAGVWTIELSPRSIGGLCSRSLVFVPGMTLEELIVRHALGMSCDNFRLTREASGVMMIPTPSRGRLRAVRGVDAARALSGIEDVTIGIPAGEMLVPLPEGDRYVGFIFARGEHPDAVEASLAAAHRTLRFDIDRTQQHSAASR